MQQTFCSLPKRYNRTWSFEQIKVLGVELVQKLVQLILDWMPLHEVLSPVAFYRFGSGSGRCNFYYVPLLHNNKNFASSNERFCKPALGRSLTKENTTHSPRQTLQKLCKQAKLRGSFKVCEQIEHVSISLISSTAGSLRNETFAISIETSFLLSQSVRFPTKWPHKILLPRLSTNTAKVKVFSLLRIVKFPGSMALKHHEIKISNKKCRMCFIGWTWHFDNFTTATVRKIWAQQPLCCCQHATCIYSTQVW